MFLEEIPAEKYMSLNIEVLYDFFNLHRHLSNKEHGSNILSLKNSLSDETNHWIYDVNERTVNHIFWNKDVPKEIKDSILEVEKSLGVKFTKIVFSCYMPGEGLIAHNDGQPRYHYVIKPQPLARLYTVENDEINIHKMDKGKLYKANTDRYKHFFYNADNEERIHLLFFERLKDDSSNY